MNAQHVWKWVPALLACGVIGTAWAKLPAPPPADPAKVAAAKQKAAESAKMAKEAQAKAEDRAVENYRRGKGAGMTAPAAAPMMKK